VVHPLLLLLQLLPWHCFHPLIPSLEQQQQQQQLAMGQQLLCMVFMLMLQG
jgi:hypothetical protein